MEYAVETFSLTKTFSDWWGRQRVRAVDELNLQIRQNEVFGLLGPNGSGKTTTIKMLLGLLHPTKGNCLILGGSGSDPKINVRIGFMPEDSYLYKYLNARETLDFYGRLFGLPLRVRKARIESLLEMVGLKAVAGRAVGTYSKGMARRIGLAQALINDPDLVILDEPTTGLDPIGTRQIKDLIIHLAKRGKTILLCSHLLADVEDVCDRIAIMYGGKIQTQGQVKELLQQSDKTQIVADSLSESAVSKIKQIIADENLDCQVTSPMEKLESFFIRTVDDARKQGKITSGVVSDSKAQIENFLTHPAEQGILEKLVADPIAEKKEILSSPDLQQTKPVEVSEPQPDKDLLGKLTCGTDDKPKTTVTTKPAQASSVDEDDAVIRKDILDQLIDRKDQGSQTDDAQGDIGNA